MAFAANKPGIRPAQSKTLWPPRIGRLLDHAADFCGGDPFTCDMRGKIARWAVMLALRGEGMSYPQIGRIVDRDHTTVIYGVQRARSLRSRDASFIALLERMGALGGPEPAEAVFPYAGHRTMAEVMEEESA